MALGNFPPKGMIMGKTGARKECPEGRAGTGEPRSGHAGAAKVVENGGGSGGKREEDLFETVERAGRHPRGIALFKRVQKSGKITATRGEAGRLTAKGGESGAGIDLPRRKHQRERPLRQRLRRGRERLDLFAASFAQAGSALEEKRHVRTDGRADDREFIGGKPAMPKPIAQPQGGGGIGGTAAEPRAQGDPFGQDDPQTISYAGGLPQRRKRPQHQVVGSGGKSAEFPLPVGAVFRGNRGRRSGLDDQGEFVVPRGGKGVGKAGQFVEHPDQIMITVGTAAKNL